MFSARCKTFAISPSGISSRALYLPFDQMLYACAMLPRSPFASANVILFSLFRIAPGSVSCDGCSGFGAGGGAVGVQGRGVRAFRGDGEAVRDGEVAGGGSGVGDSAADAGRARAADGADDAAVQDDRAARRRKTNK